MAGVVVVVVLVVRQVAPHGPLCVSPRCTSGHKTSPATTSLSLSRGREVGYSSPTSLCGFQLQAGASAAFQLSLR